MSKEVQFGMRITGNSSDAVAAANQVNNSLQAIGNTAKQTTLALRQVPMQVTDIVTGLVSGQTPMMVLIQQGGQLKDLFGGIAPAAKALSGYVAGLITPATLGAAAFAALGYSMLEGGKQSERLKNALIDSGNAIGKTSGELETLIQTTGKMTGSYGTAREAVEALAASGVVSSGQLQASLKGVTAAQILGRDVQKTVTEFEALAKEPVKAIVKLNETQNFLTLDIYKQIKALEEQGKHQEAARLAIETYSNTLRSRVGEHIQNLGFLEQTWRGVGIAADFAWNKMSGIGREKTIEDDLKAAEEKLHSLKTKTGYSGYLNHNDYGAELTAQQAVVDDLKRQIRTAKFLSDEVAKFRADQKQKIENSKNLDEYLKSESRQSESGLLINRLKEEDKAWQLATAGLEKGSAQYQAALVAHNQAVANIKEKANKPVDSALFNYQKSLDEITKSAEKAQFDGANALLEDRYKHDLVASEDYFSQKTQLENDFYAKQRERLVNEINAQNSAAVKAYRLGDQPGSIGHLSETNKLQGAIGGLDTAHAETLKKLDQQSIDSAIKKDEALRKIYSDGIDAEIEAQNEAAAAEKANLDARDKAYAALGENLKRKNEDLNAALITSDKARALRQIELEHQHEQERIGAELAGDERLNEILDEEDARYQKSLEKWQRDYEGTFVQGARSAMAKYLDEVRNTSRLSEKLFTDGISGMEDALVKFTTTGKLDFKSLADSIAADIARMEIRKNITGPMASWLEGIMSSSFGGGVGTDHTLDSYLALNANGGVYSGAGISAYSGQVVSSPTIFPFARGVGLMGEAGPEAIMPLRRDASGRLGVQASGTNGGVNVQVNLIESPGGGGQVNQRQDSNGNLTIDVMVAQITNRMSRAIQQGGGLAPVLEGQYGLNRAAGART